MKGEKRNFYQNITLDDVEITQFLWIHGKIPELYTFYLKTTMYVDKFIRESHWTTGTLEQSRVSHADILVKSRLDLFKSSVVLWIVNTVNELIHLRHIIHQNPLYVPICP